MTKTNDNHDEHGNRNDGAHAHRNTTPTGIDFSDVTTTDEFLARANQVNIVMNKEWKRIKETLPAHEQQEGEDKVRTILKV